MKINSLKLSNFGLYAGDENYFDFSKTSPKRPIVLIGGANGRGKTTILEAMLLCLYGNRSYAYLEAAPLSYQQYLAKFINKSNDNRAAEVVLSISLFFEGEKVEIKLLRRWIDTGKTIKETFEVHRNGQTDLFLTNDWEHQIEYIMPASLSRFFLFDGERVAELTQDESGEKIAEAIKLLFGLDVIDQLDVDLKTITNKNKTYKEIEKNDEEIVVLHKERDKVDEDLAGLAARQTMVEREIAAKKIKLNGLQEKFKKKNGILFANRHGISLDKSEREKELDHVNAQILECASKYFPLLIVQDLAKQALATVLTQESFHNEEKEIEGIEKFLHKIENVPEGIRGALDTKKRLFHLNRSRYEELFETTTLGLEQLRFLVNCEPDEEISAIKDLLKRKAAGTLALEDADMYLDTEIDEKGLQKIVDSIVAVNKSIVKLEAENEKLTEEMSLLKRKRETNERLLNDLMIKYIESSEIKDSAQRMLSYAIKIKKVLAEYKKSVQHLKVETLSRIVTSKFKKIVGKQALISRIEFDEESLSMCLYNDSGEEVARNQLSAGEKQLLSTSIIWGIIECSGQEFPMIIDTPLARLDSLHRSLFIKNYLPRAGQQVIVFSTDAEIVGSARDRLSGSIAKEYFLDYCERTNTTKIISDRYFDL